MTLRGRPGKPIERHLADGTRQPCRHGTRAEGLFTGRPVLPDEFRKDPEAAGLWKILLEQIPAPLLVGADTPSLVMLCRLWSEWRRIDKVLRKLSPKSELYYEILKEWTKLSRAWQALAARFGLSPIDRTRLHVSLKDVETADADPIQGFLADREGAS